MDTGQGTPAKGPWNDDGQQHGNASRARDDGQGADGPSIGNESGGAEHSYNTPAAPKGKDVPPGTTV